MLQPSPLPSTRAAHAGPAFLCLHHTLVLDPGGGPHGKHGSADVGGDDAPLQGARWDSHPPRRPPPHAWEGPVTRTATGVPTEQIKPRLLSTRVSGCLGKNWGGRQIAPRAPPRVPRKESPGWDLSGGMGVSRISGAGGWGWGGGRDSMPRSLMTQARAGGQTDIFSEEKLLWGPPSGTSLPPASPAGAWEPSPGARGCVRAGWATSGLRPPPWATACRAWKARPDT